MKNLNDSKVQSLQALFLNEISDDKKQLETGEVVRDETLQLNASFHDFYSFEQLAIHKEIMSSLIQCYQKTFSEPEIWDEYYSDEEILAKLKKELSGACALRVCIDNDLEKVIGFCWAQSLSRAEINQCMGEVKYSKNCIFDEVSKRLSDLLTNQSAVYLQDLGIDKNYRQSVSLKSLILPSIISVSAQAKDQQLVFWSVAETCITHLAEKAGIRPFYKQDNMVFFCGDLL